MAVQTDPKTPRESGPQPRNIRISVDYKGEVRNFPEGYENIPKESPHMWIVREIQQSQGTFTLTQVGCPQSNGGQQEVKYQNLEDPIG